VPNRLIIASLVIPIRTLGVKDSAQITHLARAQVQTEREVVFGAANRPGRCGGRPVVDGGNLTLSSAELSVPTGLAALIIAITPLWFLVLHSMLLEHVSTAKVSTYAHVNPVVAVFLGWLILHERVDRFILGGSVVVLFSVILVTSG